jgi:hypothetical protein
MPGERCRKRDGRSNCLNHRQKISLLTSSSLKQSQVPVHQKRYSKAEDILTKVVQRQGNENSAREDGEHTDRIQALWFLLQCYQLQSKIEDAIRIGNELSEAVKG